MNTIIARALGTAAFIILPGIAVAADVTEKPASASAEPEAYVGANDANESLSSADEIDSQSGDTGEAIVVTASAGGEELRLAPASISIVTREDLENRPFTTLADAVRGVEGVTVTGYDPNEMDIGFRGMPGEYTLIMLDGRRQSTRENMNRSTAGVQASMIPPLPAIERIEVVRGPMSSLYGSDAMGGVVNIITRKKLDRAMGSLSLGGIVQDDQSYGNTGQGSFWLGAPLGDTLTAQIFGGFMNRAEDDIFYDRPYVGGANKIQDCSLSGKLVWMPADGHDITLDGGWNRLDYTETPGKSTAANAALSEQEHDRTYQALTWNGDFGAVDTRLSVFRENEKYDVRSNGTRQYKPNLTNITVDGLISYDMGINQLSIGGQYRHVKVTSVATQDNVSGYTNPDKLTRESWAIFAEDRLEPMVGLIFTGGLRLDHDEHYGSHLSPRLYANYAITPIFSIKGGWAEGFKAPTLRQTTAGYCMTTGGASLPRGPLCGNPDLKPEQSSTYEVGVRADLSRRQWAAVTFFHTDFRNKVSSFGSNGADPVNPSRPLYVYGNVDEVKMEGIEVGLATPLGKTVDLAATYTWLDSERFGGIERSFDGTSIDGYPLDMSPEHSANVRLNWDATDQISAYAAARYSGRQVYAAFRNGATGPRTRPDSTTFDLGITFRANDNLTLSMAALNITDKIVPVDDRGRFEGLDGNWLVDEGRRFWGKATLSF